MADIFRFIGIVVVGLVVVIVGGSVLLGVMDGMSGYEEQSEGVECYKLTLSNDYNSVNMEPAMPRNYVDLYEMNRLQCMTSETRSPVNERRYLIENGYLDEEGVK